MKPLTRLAVAVLVAAGFTVLGPVVAHKAKAHDWYSKYKDPRFAWSCCGGIDCSRLTVDPVNLTMEEGGYRVRLTLEQAQMINRYAQYPVDAVVAWDRVQASEDGNYHLCIMTANRSGEAGGVYCLFVPPNT